MHGPSLKSPLAAHDSVVMGAFMLAAPGFHQPWRMWSAPDLRGLIAAVQELRDEALTIGAVVPAMRFIAVER